MRKAKTYNYIGALLLVGALLLGCDDFLDRDPLSKLTNEDLGNDGKSTGFTTASQAEAILAGCYGDFRNEYFQLDYYVNGDAQADNAYAGADNPNNFQIDEYAIESVNNNVLRDWRYLYSTIAKANTVLDHIDSVTDAALTETRRAEIKGEAAFVRAYMYFELVRQYGDIPLLVHEITEWDVDDESKIYLSRTPQAEIYQQIIKDLELAVANTRATTANKNVATKSTAHFLLAKVYATVEPHDWAKVNEHADAVLAAGYELLPEFDQLWDGTHENSSEAIFEITYDGWDAGTGNWGAGMFYGIDWKKFNTPTNDLVAAFDAEGDEIRKNASIRFADVTGKWSDRYWPLTNFPYSYKYRNTNGTQNYILFRLADIMLLKAEALTDAGDLEGAADLVNEIRARVDLDAITPTTDANMVQAIAKERRLELVFEGQRWYDLKRTGKAIEVMNALRDGNGNSLGYQLTEDRLLWPIPQNERDKNEKLIQNDGY
jgi:starch-binding outer membrane protein, SusD/RagB family